MIYIILALLIIAVIYLYIEMQIEKRRNRILQAFSAGIIKSVSNYISRTDLQDISSAKDLTDINDKLFPIQYETLINNISKEFRKDFWMKPYWGWLKTDRNIFHNDKYANDGFNMIYWDFYDNEVSLINKESNVSSGNSAG